MLLSGPEAVTIVKNNVLQTTATGIITAGKYTFTLTVTDEDGASSSKSVIVTVKDGKSPAWVIALILKPRISGRVIH